MPPPPGDGGWVLAEELIAKSRELRYRDPAGMVRLAEMARLVGTTSLSSSSGANG